MECNKEEAIRAKEIALKKMENQDFAGARKVAIKTQLLYPGLENINQIICVCDVHCSAENKKLGNVRDWYDLLNVEQSADETLIKKQYRKLALLLHPDKNKFSGAESAFMLIGEAQEVLLDKDKRIKYDAIYRRFFQNAAPKNAKTGSSDVLKKPQQQADPVDPSRIETFWTVCPFCSIRDRYSSALNENLKCQSCKKEFATYDMCAKSTPPGSKVSQTDTSAKKGVFNQASCAQGVSSKGGCSGTSNGKSKTTDELKTGAKSRASPGGSSHAEVKDGKKGKKQVAVEEACVTVGKIEKKKHEPVGKNGDTVTEEKKNQVSAERNGDSVAKRARREVKDSFERSGRRRSQSKVCTGPEDKIAEKGGGASASSQSKKRVSDTEAEVAEETLNLSKVTKREKRKSAEIAGVRVAKPANRENDSLARSQFKVCTEPEDKAVEKAGVASAEAGPSFQSKKRVSETWVGGAEQTLNSLKRRKGNCEVETTDFRNSADFADENGRSNPGMLKTPVQGLLSELLLQLVMKLQEGYNNFTRKTKK